MSKFISHPDVTRLHCYPCLLFIFEHMALNKKKRQKKVSLAGMKS